METNLKERMDAMETDPETDIRPNLARAIAEKAILLFSGQHPQEIEETSIRTDCFLAYGYTGSGDWSVMVTLLRNESGKAVVTVHNVNTLRHATYIYSYMLELDGKPTIQLIA
ncbi:MAG: hypothetical protein Q8N84_01800 [bacterium]|nr:hypothetical protein [bacterium]